MEKITNELKEKFEPFDIESVRSELEYVEFKDLEKIKNPIIFDTNFLFVTFQFKLDVICEIERIIGKTFSLYIYEGTIMELSNLFKKQTPNKKFMPLIRTMFIKYNFKIIKSSQNYIDDQILENLNKNIFIATNDKLLRQKIMQGGGKGILLRQKSYLELF